MYNAPESSSEATHKYTVADILSSMANGELMTPTFTESALPSYAASVSTGLTPTLTPTTLANLEQFIELNSFATTPTTAAAPSMQQSGFVPPAIHPLPVKTEYYSDEYDLDSEDSDYQPPSKKQVIEIVPGGSAYGQSSATPSKPGPRRHTGPRPRKIEHLTPEEKDKRKVRRERNKLAAAKCRQRRVDHTNLLINETEKLEEDKSVLESEIQALQQHREQLEFVLKAHRTVCSAPLPVSGVAVKSEPVDSGMALSRPTSLPLTYTASYTSARAAPPAASMAKLYSGVTEATGITISTPSSGFVSTIGLDCLTDGHTGLTPLTGSAPSCSSQLQRNSTDSSSNEGLASPTTLMAL